MTGAPHERSEHGITIPPVVSVELDELASLELSSLDPCPLLEVLGSVVDALSSLVVALLDASVVSALVVVRLVSTELVDEVIVPVEPVPLPELLPLASSAVVAPSLHALASTNIQAVTERLTAR